MFLFYRGCFQRKYRELHPLSYYTEWYRANHDYYISRWFVIKNSFPKRITITSQSINCRGPGFISVRSSSDPGARIFPIVKIRMWVPEHWARHSLSVCSCRCHHHQDTLSYFSSDSGFIPSQTRSRRIPLWPATSTARRSVKRPWNRMKLTWSNQLNQSVLNNEENYWGGSASWSCLTKCKLRAKD